MSNPPEYTPQEVTTERGSATAPGQGKAAPWYRSKFLGIPFAIPIVLGFLVLFGVIFGAVYGTLHGQSSSGGDVADSALLRNSKNVTSFGNETTASPSPTVSRNDATETAMPTEALYISDMKPRDISVAPVGTTGSPDFVLWDLQWDADYTSRKMRRADIRSGVFSGEWKDYTDLDEFLVAPISVRTSSSSQMAFSLSAKTGRVVYSIFDDDDAGDTEWKSLDIVCECWRKHQTYSGHLVTRPSALSRFPGKVDLFAVDNAGRVLTTSYNDGKWAPWTALSKSSATEHEPSAVSWGPDRIDIFITTGDAYDVLDPSGVIRHRFWTSTSGWSDDWSTLKGVNTPSPPRAIAWTDSSGNGNIDVVVTESCADCSNTDTWGGSTLHRLYTANAWSANWTIMLASHEGYEFWDSQSIWLDASPAADTGSPVAHLVSRGTSDCIHYTTFNGTSWDYWDVIWCKPAGLEYDPMNPYSTAYMGLSGGAGRGAGTGWIVARDMEKRVMWYRIDGEERQTVRNGENPGWVFL